MNMKKILIFAFLFMVSSNLKPAGVTPETTPGGATIVFKDGNKTCFKRFDDCCCRSIDERLDRAEKCCTDNCRDCVNSACDRNTGRCCRMACYLGITAVLYFPM